VESTLPDEEKIEHAAKAEPEPAAKKVNATTAAPPPAPKANPTYTAPRVNPQPAVNKPPVQPPPSAKIAPPRVDPPPKAAVHVESALAAGSPIEQLQGQWRKIINESPNGLPKTPAAALLRNARPVSIDGDTLVVTVSHPYHKEKMDILENQKTADKIVSSFLGRACKVRCVYEHENNHLVKALLESGAQVIETEGK
jgi:hypothetical protein